MTMHKPEPIRHYRLELSATRAESITVSIEGSVYDCGDGPPRHDQAPPTYARPGHCETQHLRPDRPPYLPLMPRRGAKK